MTAERKAIGDRYELGRSLGADALGEVFEGHDRRLGRPVTVHVLHARLGLEATFRARFERAAAAAARLDHPNTVPVRDWGFDGDVPYVVTEAADGPSLREVLAGQGPLPTEQAVAVAADVCSALATAHAQGLQHGGLEPASVLLGPDGRARVAGIGLGPAALAPGLAGAAEYLAPEQVHAGLADDRSDLYALGCCLYEMVTGRPPFSGPSPGVVALCHLNEQPPPPHVLRPDVPAALEAVIARALAKRPSDRWQTAAELRRALQRVGQGGGQRVPGSHPERVRALTRAPRRPERVVLAAGLGVAVVALALVAVAVASSPERPTGQVARFATAPPATAPPGTLPPTTTPPAPAPAAGRMPQLVGLPLAEATRRLQEAGGRPGAVRRARAPGTAKGSVLATSPAAGLALAAGQPVDLVVSSGADPVTVADLVALIDEDPVAAGPRAPRFRGRLVRLERLTGERRRAEIADLLRIARAGASNGDFSRRFSAAAVEVLGGLR